MTEHEPFEDLDPDADALKPGAQFEPEFADIWPGDWPPKTVLPPIIASLYVVIGAVLVWALVVHKFLAAYVAVATVLGALLAAPAVFRWPPWTLGYVTWKRIRREDTAFTQAGRELAPMARRRVRVMSPDEVATRLEDWGWRWPLVSLLVLTAFAGGIVLAGLLP